MKNNILTFLIILCAVFVINGQDKKDKKKKQDEPQLTVVEVAETPPVIPIVERQKPANGSLFSDDSVNGNLLLDFKARKSGDLVFIDVIETSSATVSSGAKRNRDSGDLGGSAQQSAQFQLPERQLLEQFSTVSDNVNMKAMVQRSASAMFVHALRHALLKFCRMVICESKL